jgi:hypothetical protein
MSSSFHRGAKRLPQQPATDTEPPANRAQRRGHGKQKGPAPDGGGKVRGAAFGGPATRQYQVRKGG